MYIFALHFSDEEGVRRLEYKCQKIEDASHSLTHRGLFTSAINGSSWLGDRSHPEQCQYA